MRGGKVAAAGALVGAVMKATGGRPTPAGSGSSSSDRLAGGREVHERADACRDADADLGADGRGRGGLDGLPGADVEVVAPDGAPLPSGAGQVEFYVPPFFPGPPANRGHARDAAARPWCRR